MTSTASSRNHYFIPEFPPELKSIPKRRLRGYHRPSSLPRPTTRSTPNHPLTIVATRRHPAAYDTRVPPSVTIPYPTPVSPHPSQLPRPASPDPGVDSAATLEIPPHVLTINDRSLSVPEDPLAAFCHTRSRTMASFRAYFVGTAVGEDIDLLLVQASTRSLAAPPAAVALDGHIFDTPTHPVKAFLATRDMMLTAYRRAAPSAEGGAGPGGGARSAGTAGERDMAFLCGSAALCVEEDGDPTQEDGDLAQEDGHGVQEGDDLAQGVKESEEQASSSLLRSTVSPPPVTSGRSVVYDVGGEEDHDFMPSSPFRHRPEPHHIPAETADSTPTSSTTVTAKPIRCRAATHYPPNTFLGDFTSFVDAHLKLGKKAEWHRGTYIEGPLSNFGKFAGTKELVGMSRCYECRRSGSDTVANIMLGLRVMEHTHPPRR
ncbi:hypothetical protein DFP73DRAFT_529846 [Morchella snyderi]|nr:hypothetical protein DFP73DRAFT_529846 [Morchella snyderi]